MTPEILLGPPGTGKTTQLLKILDEELRAGVEPQQVGFVTFTRKGAQEGLDRVLAQNKLSRKDVPNFRTLHSIAMRYSGLQSGQLLEGDRLKEFADWVGETIKGRTSVDGVWSGYERGDRLLFMDNLARIRRVSLRELYDHDHDDLDWATVERFSRGLREYKAAHQLYDFSDMLERFVGSNARPRLQVVLVDEAQDLSLLQWDVVRHLVQDARRVVVAGDDDQALFVWAGADVDTLIDMPGEVRVLEQSYRVPRTIQSLAAGLIERVRHRRPKTWSPRSEDGRITWLTRPSQADYSGDDTLVLARNRHQLDEIENDLRMQGILYEREGWPSVPAKLLRAVVTWERLRRGEPQVARDVVSGPYDLMTAGVGILRGHKKLPAFHPDQPVTLDELKKSGGLKTDLIWFEALDRVDEQDRSYLRRCRRNKERLTQPPRVRLSTIHGSKGGQANRVVLLTDMAPRTWREYEFDPDSEHRTWYVAATRAREELQIVSPQTSRAYDL